MGFFGKLKLNFNHGGVKVEMTAPETVSEMDPGFSVAITITNTGEAPQTVKVVKISLIEDRMQTMNGQATNTTSSSQRQMSVVSDANPFVLQPTEAKQMTLTVPLNMGKFAQEALPDNAFAQGAAKLLGGLQTVMDAADTSNFKHYVEVVADVDGISFDPSRRQEIQVLKPGQIGGSVGKHINISL